MRYVWRWARHDLVAHDAYCCRKFSGTRAFPTRRRAGPGNYVGSVVEVNATLDLESEGAKCPLKCRPDAHKDWEFC